MKKFLVAGVISSLAALVLGAGGPAVAQTTATGKAAAIVEPSVVYIEQHWTARVSVPATIANGVEYTKGYLGEAFTFSTRCTGFVINPDGYVATAGHCVDPSREEGAAKTAILNYGIPRWLDLVGWEQTEANYNSAFEGLDPLSNWKVEGPSRGTPPSLEVVVQHGVAAGGIDTGEAMSARVIDYQAFSAGDIALLKVESANPLPAVELAKKESIDVGSEIISIGYPGAADEVTDATYEPTFQDGQINSQKTREGGTLPIYEMSSEMSGGMSGGPTVDMQGRVVGINSFEHAEETSFDFITPVSLLNEMLAQNGIEAKQGPNDVAYREGLTAFFAADYDRAAYEFQRVTQLAPEHKLAQEYLQKALGKGGDPALGNPANQGSPIALIAGAIAGVLVIGGGAAWMLMRRRRRRAPAPTAAPALAPPAMAEATVAPNGHGNGNGHTEAIGNGEIAEPVAPKPRRKSPSATAKKSTATRASAATKTKVAAPAKGAATSRTTATRRTGKFCPDCGNKNVASAKFCENCGHAF